ncbi:MAG TPA: pit accessory protein [Methylomirabilota bacterium]|nr:pit accessory protein [Methylomirabilota bacterium]
MISLQRFFGKEDKFFDLLEASAQEACSSISALVAFLKNPTEKRTLDDFIVSRRNEKRIYGEISEALCRTFVTALEREDIEALSLALYKIPKTVEKVGERLLIAPHFLQGIDLTKQILMLEKATSIVVEMIKELRKGIDMERIKKLNDQLHVVEGEADKFILEEFRKLYSVGQPGDAIKIVFLKDIFELIEKVIDRCRDAGNVVSHIVLKNS